MRGTLDNQKSLCKIVGDQKTEKIKERIWRIQLNIVCLERALKTLKRIWDEFQQPVDQRDEMILEALTFYAVVEYTKCFNSELSDKLDPSIFSDQLSESAGPDVLSEREFHNLIMNYRNMHLVHSDRLLKVADTGGIKLLNNEFAIGQIAVTRAYREDFEFYDALNALVKRALAEANKRIAAAQQKLMDAVKSGSAVITEDPIELMPVSNQITPREMWGLPPRNP